MERNNFRVIALSNSSPEMFPNNKPQKFKFQLVQPLDLQCTWEVGVTNVSYPLSWFNITEDTVFKIDALIRTEEEVKRFGVEQMFGSRWSYEFKFGKGYYNSINDITVPLMAMIQQKADEYSDSKFNTKQYFTKIKEQLGSSYREPVQFTQYYEDTNRTNFLKFDYRGITKKVKLYPQHQRTAITIIQGLDLWKSLCFDFKLNEKNPIPWLGLEAPNLANLTVRFPSMFICCDVVRPTNIGTSMQPLIRSVDIKSNRKDGSNQDQIYRDDHFTPAQYVPVSKGYISTLEFWVEDDQGVLVPFQTGKTSLTLRFRRVA